MIGIVWGSTYDKAFSQLEKIRDQYLYFTKHKVVYQKFTLNYSLLEFDNGDVWKAMTATDSRRGEACNISYIDIEIDDAIINTIIRPATKRAPYTAIHYF